MMILNKTTKIQFFIFILLVITSHIIIPQFNKQDFIIFSTWNLFSNSIPHKAIDLRFNSKEYLYQNKFLRSQAENSMNTFILFNFLIYEKFDQLTTQYKKQLKEFCNCEKIEIVYLDGTLADHIINKKDLNILKILDL